MTIISLYKIYESMFPGNSRVLDKHFFFLDKKAISDFLEKFQWNEANRSLIMGGVRKGEQGENKDNSYKQPICLCIWKV